MLDLSYVYLALAVLALLILFYIALKISKVIKNLNQNLELLPPLLMNLRSSSEKLQETLEIMRGTGEKLHTLLEELRVVPRIVEEVGESLKDLEAFLKGQIETVKDDLHFTLEDLRVVVKDTQAISQELKNKTLQVSQGVDPLIRSLTESASTVKLLLDNLNSGLKKTVIEVSAVTTGVSEVLRGLKRLLKI